MACIPLISDMVLTKHEAIEYILNAKKVCKHLAVSVTLYKALDPVITVTGYINNDDDVFKYIKEFTNLYAELNAHYLECTIQKRTGSDVKESQIIKTQQCVSYYDYLYGGE